MVTFYHELGEGTGHSHDAKIIRVGVKESTGDVHGDDVAILECVDRSQSKQ